MNLYAVEEEMRQRTEQALRRGAQARLVPEGPPARLWLALKLRRVADRLERRSGPPACQAAQR
jgi:hypothetical protein